MSYIKIVFVVFLSLLLLHQVNTFAQIKIVGKTLDLETGKPLDEVKIFFDSKHTHSDMNGYFEIAINQLNDSILFSKAGYEKQIIKVDSIHSFYNVYIKEKSYILPEIEIVADNQKAASPFSKVDLNNKPVQSSQDLLRIIPGMFIAQHAGGGKAEQMFIRGFDIDHGTDFKLSVDGIPVNMVSHAHGQGYADLHFVIPELVKNINYQLGPYNAENGNFTTAGAANFETIDKPQHSISKFEYGNLGFKRSLLILDLSNKKYNENIGYIAAEGFFNNGAFEHPQNYNRYNLNSKYTFKIADNQSLQVLFTTFSSKWDASGQIPERAVNAGLINYWGAIDPSEGGNTSRTNLSLIHQKKFTKNVHLKTQLYAVNYGFNLFSNFTFFLNDLINGDQINQKENRTILGGESKLNVHHYKINGFLVENNIGIGFRNDFINDISLSNTVQRKFLSYKTLGDIQELNTYSYVSESISFKKWIINAGFRFDNIQFNWQNKQDLLFINKIQNASNLQPKFSVAYNLNNRYQLFAKYGKGFHSNDVRVITSNDAIQSLPSAHGFDLGIISKPLNNLMLQFNVWQLSSAQEFVYVGDDAIVELAGKSQRKGLDFLMRYQLKKSIQIDFDINYSDAQLVNLPNNENFIPLAPKLTSVGGISFLPIKNLSCSVRYRHLADRAANESNTIVAKGYQIFDFSMNYQIKNVQWQISINNLLNTNWKEAQFATESRLKNEQNAVEEIHFTPGNPFFIKTSITVNLN